MAQILGLRQLFGLNIVGKDHASWPEVHKIHPELVNFRAQGLVIIKHTTMQKREPYRLWQYAMIWL